MDIFRKAVNDNNQKAIDFLFENLNTIDCLNVLNEMNKLDAIAITDLSMMQEVIKTNNFEFIKAIIDNTLSSTLMNDCLLLAIECENLDVIKYLIETKQADIFCIKSTIDNKEIEAYLCEKRDDFVML